MGQTTEDRLASTLFRSQWIHKTPEEVVHEFVAIYGNLSDQSAQDALAKIIQFKIDAALEGNDF